MDHKNKTQKSSALQEVLTEYVIENANLKIELAQLVQEIERLKKDRKD